ncbi:MAG: hypothetical protein A3F17_01245, partial [Gammaproteobacteria bacterium RIFCSPHIGHO2_12_FULL_41_15]
YLIEHFGKQYYSTTITINFELQPEYKDCFHSLQPETILNQLEGLLGTPIHREQSLLFLDEIQECPRAIMALRYFKEQMPKLAVIAAGSLLEFALRDENFRMPVGRVEFAYLKPLSFYEYLQARGYETLLTLLRNTSLTQPPTSVIHKKLLELVKEYTLVGGMPAAVNAFLQTGRYQDCQHMQTVILSTYRNDFGKYANQAHHKYLQKVFTQTPGLVGKSIKYTQFDQEMRSRDLKTAIQNLTDAGILYRVIATAASGLPLNIHSNDKLFKLLLLDVGLVSRAMGIGVHELVGNTLLLNKGAITEQWVGQELLAYRDPSEETDLFYWCRNKPGSQAEVDYVIHADSHIIPIEVKTGATGQLKSLQLFLKEKNIPVGVRISQHPLSTVDQIMSVPFYLISEIPRLVSELAK